MAWAGQLIIRAAREGQPIICLSALFAPVMARSPSSKRALGRPSCHLPFVHLPTFMAHGPSGPAYRLPFCSICPRYGQRPEWASLSLAFLFNLLPLWCAARAGQFIIAWLLYTQCGPRGPAYALCLICGASRSTWKALHGRGTPYYSIKNGHASRCLYVQDRQMRMRCEQS